MMEVLFRAKRIDNGEWAEGFYFKTYGCKNGVKQDAYFIHNYDDDEDYSIVPETIGLYIGLLDWNQRKIFEGDIVEIDSPHIGVDEEDGYFFVEWDTESARFILFGDGLTVDFDNIYGYECKVVGNRFDNPDLKNGYL